MSNGYIPHVHPSLLGLGACEEELHNHEVFARLSQKKDKKAATRAAAASNAAYWMERYKACQDEASRPKAPATTPAIQPVTGGGGPVVNQPLPTAQIPATPAIAPLMPQVYSQAAHQAGPYIAQSIPAEWLEMLTKQNGLPASSGSSVPAAQSSLPPLEECTAAFNSMLPLTYEDEFGPMTVKTLVCK